MRIYSNNRRGENTLDRMKITIRVPGNEKFGIITHFERPSVHILMIMNLVKHR